MHTPHSSTYKGKRVFIIFRDGTSCVDIFLDHKSGCVLLKKAGRVPIARIRSFSIAKPNGYNAPN